MPGPVPGIRVFLWLKIVDGRDQPRHDDERLPPLRSLALDLREIRHRAGRGADFVEQLQPVFAERLVVGIDRDLVEERIDAWAKFRHGAHGRLEIFLGQPGSPQRWQGLDMPTVVEVIKRASIDVQEVLQGAGINAVDPEPLSGRFPARSSWVSLGRPRTTSRQVSGSSAP